MTAPVVVQKKLIIGELKGTAHPVGPMRSILGCNTRARAIAQWKEFHAEIVCANLKTLVQTGTISRAQYRKVVKAVMQGMN